MADEVIRLAYDEARTALREQDATLSNVRNRSSALLTAAAIGTSFSATAGLLNTDPGRGRVFPEWAAWSLLAAVVLIAVGVMMVLWPASDWQYGPSPNKILSKAGADVNEVLHIATQALVAAVGSNDLLVTRRVQAYRATVLLLMIEIGILVVALLLARR